MKERLIHTTRFSSLLLLLLLLGAGHAQFDFLTEQGTAACRDAFPWCPSQKGACDDVRVVRDQCRETCDNCPSREGVCRDAGCTQECMLTAGGTRASCGCFGGYELDEDGRSCRDINECRSNKDVCAKAEDPICVNTPGSFTCTTCRALAGLSNYYQTNICCKRNAKNFRDCGSSSTNGRRIVGGVPGLVGRWPWMAHIQIGKVICGGSLVQRRWIVTSADCLKGRTPSSIRVTMGALNTTGEVVNLHEQRFRVHRIVIHPDFDFPYNDIALIRLRTSALLGSSVGTVCLPNGHEPRVGETCYATGYGRIRFNGEVAGHLQEVDLPVVDHEVCQRAYDNDSISVDPTVHMCAGHVEGGKDTCQGDSGGPLVCQRCNNCDWYLAGITSFGKGCARPGEYGVYTRVAQFEQWIARNILTRVRKSTCVRPEWHAWGGWTDCTVTCGGGKRSRTRFCINGDRGEPDCLGDENETEPCGTQESRPEAVRASWSTWTETECSVTCGEGVITKTRICLNGHIGDPGCEIGGDTSSVDCNENECERWGPFGDFGECAATCGPGIRVARRECIGGDPGDPGCPGMETMTRACNEEPCKGWGPWSSYGRCSRTCAGGRRTRRRTCLNRRRSNGSPGCEGAASQTEDCNEQKCPRWGRFPSFGECSVSCGGGEQTSERTCEYGMIGQNGCRGPSVRRRPCNTGCCPTWSEFSTFSECSKSCGGGTQTSERTCQCGTIGQDGCLGDSVRSRPCNERCCPTWSEFSTFSECSESCGGGTQTSERTCQCGTIGQDGCLGDSVRSRPCNENVSCIVPVCCDVFNVEEEETCLGFVRRAYCDTFFEYMQTNCRRACCQFRNNLICQDGHLECPLYRRSCQQPQILATCPVTCGACPPHHTCD